MMSQLISVFLVVIICFSSGMLCADDDTKIFNDFMSHISDKYYKKIKERFEAMDSETRANKIAEWINDANYNASLNGYALFCLKMHESRWDDEQDRLFNMLVQRCKKLISKQSEGIAERKDWDFLEQTGHESEALFSFNETYMGNVRRIRDLVELTGVRPEDVSNFLAKYKTADPGDQLSVDISGTWNSSIGNQYVVTQTATSFSWTVPGHKETAKGTIKGKKVHAKWGEDGRTTGEEDGKIEATDDQGRATRIVWDNGVVFHR